MVAVLFCVGVAAWADSIGELQSLEQSFHDEVALT